MSYKHSAFIFDYREFMFSISTIVDALEKGNETPLKDRVYRIRQKFGDRNWILENNSTSTGNLGWDQDSKYRQGLWGHWILIVFSEYLSSCTSLEYEWTELSHLLRIEKWEDEDIWKLLVGLPVAQLIKPQEKNMHDLPIRWSDPYWYWIRPERSRYSGWLPKEEINRLSNKLHQIDIKVNIDKSKSFTLVKEMIEEAKLRNLGLYMCISESADG